MTNQLNLAAQAVQKSSNHKALPSKSSIKALLFALGLSLIPALGIAATSYHFVSKTVTQQISQTQSGDTSISPALQRELLLELTLLSGVTALLAGAIAFVGAQSAIARLLDRRLSLSSSTPQYSQKALLFGEIVSQSQPIDLDSLYKRVVEGARDILRTDRVIIYTFDADWKGTIVAESVAPGLVESLCDEIVDTCIRNSKGGLYKNGRVCVFNDITQANFSDCHLDLLAKYQVKANMVVPLLKDERVLGLLIAHQCDQPRVWQPNEIDFFMQLASFVALRLSDLNFLQQRATLGHVQSFASVALRIRQSLDLEEIFNTAATEIRQALNVDRVIICRLSPNLQEGTVIAESVSFGWLSMLGRKLAELGIGEHPLKLFKSGYVHPINNLPPESALNNSNQTGGVEWGSETGDRKTRASGEREGIAQLSSLNGQQPILPSPTPISEMTPAAQYKVKASLVAPIRIDNQFQGLIIAHQCSATRTWEPSTIALLEELAAQVGLAVEQANLLKSVAAEARRTQFLADFTSRVRQSLNPDDIFSPSVEEIRSILECDRVLIYRVKPDGKSGEITAQAVAPGWTLAPMEKINKLFREENYQGHQTGSLWVTHDINDSSLTPNHLRLLERLQIKASMVAPIIASDQLVGLLCAHHCSGRRNWQQAEFYFFKQLAVQMGFALDQVTLIEQIKVVSQQQQQQTEKLRHQLFSLIKNVEGAVKGDLTVRADVSEGEIGTVADFFNVVIESMREIVTQVKQATTQVNAFLGDNQGAISELSWLSLKQAEETTRTLDSVEKMTLSLQQVASCAIHAAEVARTASETAQTGTEAMERTVHKIVSLRETVAEAANKVRRLGESSQQISKVVSLINQIALQTNLLALNAGIEAARVGEESQGFAVVAKQVSELAARSAEATQEIEQIVETIQQETAQVVEAMKRGTTQVVEGTELVEDTKQSLRHILAVSREIDQLVASISFATGTQVKTSSAVSELMKEMANVSERTSMSSHQISDSLQQTVKVAQQLQSSVEVFKVDETNSSERSQ